MKAMKSSSLNKRETYNEVGHNGVRNYAMREALIPLRNLLKGAALAEAKAVREIPKGRSLFRYLFEGVLPVVRDAGNEATVMYLHTGEEAIVYVFRPSYISEKNGLNNLKLQMRIFLEAVTKMTEGSVAYFGLAPAEPFAFNTRRNYEYDHALEHITEKGQFVKLTRSGTLATYDRKGNPIEAAYVLDELIQRGEVPTDELRAKHAVSIERDKRKAEEKRLRKERLAQEEAIQKAAKAIPVTEEDATAMNSEVIQNAKKKKKKKKAKQNGDPAVSVNDTTAPVVDTVTAVAEAITEASATEVNETEVTTPVVEEVAVESPVEPVVTEIPAAEMTAPVYETLENALESANVVDPVEAPAAEPAVGATEEPVVAESPAETVEETTNTAVEVTGHE